jgi:hypothetical protein
MTARAHMRACHSSSSDEPVVLAHVERQALLPWLMLMKRPTSQEGAIALSLCAGQRLTRLHHIYNIVYINIKRNSNTVLLHHHLNIHPKISAGLSQLYILCLKDAFNL